MSMRETDPLFVHAAVDNDLGVFFKTILIFPSGFGVLTTMALRRSLPKIVGKGRVFCVNYSANAIIDQFLYHLKRSGFFVFRPLAL